MFSFPSWQTFPSVSLPQNIQRRFVSYFLRKALGHLVKPGQFDNTQIDAQIGSGTVQVTDVEFNHDALNEKLRSAQLPFILESGSLGKITANLPWPNLFTAPVALSLSSLDITLVYSPTVQSSTASGLSVDGISESVNHMAESFIQDELGPTKSFRQSQVPEDTSYNPPGTFDPFVKRNPEITIVNNDEELTTPGVSLIAMLIERLLSRFKFDMSNLRIKVVFPEKTALTFSLERLTYKTEEDKLSTAGQGEVRMLSSGNIFVSMNVLSSPHSPLSVSSDFSDNGDETMDLMSQSLAALPARDHASSSTVDASLYHSVLSTLPEAETSSFGRPEENQDERLISLGHGTDSIFAELTTPSLHTSPGVSNLKTDMKLTLSISPILISLNPVQVGILLDVLSLFDNPDPSASSVSNASDRTMFENWSIKVNFNSMDCILSTPPTLTTEQHIINNLHFQYPALCDLGLPHLRVSLRNLDVHVQLYSSTFLNPEARSPHHRFQGSLENVSVFLISYDDEEKAIFSPVLISDLDLHPQYNVSSSDTSLPIFNIDERTRTSDGPEASKKYYLRSPQSKPTNSSDSCVLPVLRIQSSVAPERTIEFDFVPLHIYFDIGMIAFLNSYVEYVRKTQSTTPRMRTQPQQISRNNAQMTASTCLEEDGSGMGFIARFSFIRVEVSTAAPNLPVSKSRSGILVLDAHQFQILRGTKSSSKSPVTVLCTLQFRTVIVALALPNVVKAEAFLSIVATTSADAPITPSVCFRTITTTESSLPSSSSSVDIAFSSLTVSLSKVLLDGIMYWLDDLSKWNATLTRTSMSDKLPSRGNSKYTSSWSSKGDAGDSRQYESVVKLSLDEGQINLLIPRSGENAQTRPLRIVLMKTEVLMEISPEGKSETVITLGIKGIDVIDNPQSERPSPILHLTQPHIADSTRPLIKLRYTSTIENSLAHKFSKIKLSLSGFTFHLSPNKALMEDLQLYSKSPEGVFETVVPNDRTIISLSIVDGSIEVTGRSSLGAAVFYIGELNLGTILVDGSPEINLKGQVLSSAALFIDDMQTLLPVPTNILDPEVPGIPFWKNRGYVSLAEINDSEIQISFLSLPLVRTEVYINGMKVNLHACADTISAFTVFMNSVMKEITPSVEEVAKPAPVHINQHTGDLMASLDEEAFSRLSGLGPVADMINDDLPTNPDYLDVSYGAAGGFREMEEEDLLDFEDEPPSKIEGVISNFGGETVRMLDPEGITVTENYFENIVPEVSDADMWSQKSILRIRASNCDVTFSLYEGYDCLSTRRSIEEEIRLMRRRLVKIKQLLAEGQVPDGSVENTSAMLFNSVSIGLQDDLDDMEPPALLAAIDKELQYDENLSESSWQSLTPPLNNTSQPPRLHNLKLDRSQRSLIDFCLTGMRIEIDSFDPTHDLLSKVLVAIKNVEILDHIKTSTWKKFLTQLRVDFRGNARETDSDMVRAELRLIRSVPGVSSKEGRFRLKILPIKLNVDQDALDFMKKFFSFQNSTSTDDVSEPQTELYFQHVEVFPVDLKLDYKPKRVDYRALRQGKAIELMNFFHFDGSEITLRHITLSGITGWARLFETLNDLWTPDVKANQLADIISGVSPIRSVVNVGSGVADLVLLPIAQYKKDKRLVRGVQKGTAAFMKSTAMEAVKLGARLATGTQVILEQAETVLGGQGQFRRPITVETVQLPDENADGRDVRELISRYADQPQDVREGVQFAYQSLSRNFHSAAQTILAVPMEVYERSGNEGAVRAIVRAVPIAVLKPMIGASEAVSKTLFGLRNTLDPEVRHDNEAKYKHR